MPIYRAPIDEYKFVLNDLLEIDKHRDLPDFGDLTPDLLDDILTNAGKFCEEVLQPINQSGDEEGAHFENGVVRTPKGFKEAYKAYCDAGWGALVGAGEIRRRRLADARHAWRSPKWRCRRTSPSRCIRASPARPRARSAPPARTG